MKNISAWAIRHPVTPIVLFVVLTFFGVVALRIRLPINLQPDVSFPEVERQYFDSPARRRPRWRCRSRKKVGRLDREHRQYPSSADLHFRGKCPGSIIEFNIGTPIDRAVTDVRDAIARVRADLPQEHSRAAGAALVTMTAGPLRSMPLARPI